jgi:hypothetical protein
MSWAKLAELIELDRQQAERDRNTPVAPEPISVATPPRNESDTTPADDPDEPAT